MNGLIAEILALTGAFNLLLLISTIPFVKEEYKNPPLLMWLLNLGLHAISGLCLAGLYFFAPYNFNPPSALAIVGFYFFVLAYSGVICFFSYLSKVVSWKKIWKVSFVVLIINIALMAFALWLPLELRVLAPSFWTIILSSWFLYTISSSTYPKGEYLIYSLKVLAVATLLPSLIWLGLVLDSYYHISHFLPKDQLLSWGDPIRIIRNLSAPLSFLVMFIYWIKYHSLFAIKAKQDKDKVQTLLQEKDQLIYELSKVNSLASAGALAGGLAHELNQHLARIQINADEALDEAINNPEYESMKSSLKRILEANRDAAGMIDALRATFTVRNEARTLVEISKSVRDVTNLYRGRMVQSKIELQLDALDSIGIISWGAQLTIVLSNLVLNAIEALDAGSNSKKIIAITYEFTEKYILIKIFDSGNPIHPSKASSLFTLFSTTKKQGIGVGLWLSKFIMEKHDGDLSFENSNEGGVEFILSIPKNSLVKQ